MKKEDEEKKLHISRKPSTSSNFEASSDVTNKINNVRSEVGSSFDNDTRELMESRFGYDFSGVRIHRDTRAAQSARLVNALAYTIGNDITFGDGQYQPNAVEGRRLLAHELTHVIQQSGRSMQLIQRSELPCKDKIVGKCKDEIVSHRRILRGSVHPAVREAQCKLNLFHEQQTKQSLPGLVDAPLVLDCVFGQKTFNATVSFQKIVFPKDPQFHTGNIFEKTWAELDKISLTTPKIETKEKEEPPTCAPITCPFAPTQPVTPSPPSPPLEPQRINPGITSGAQCRGACGPDCPGSCTPHADIVKCVEVTGCHATCTYHNVTSCSTHEGCRQHDECYDRCAAAGERNHCGCPERACLLGLVCKNPCHCRCDRDCCNAHDKIDCAGWALGSATPSDGRFNYSDNVTVGPALPGPCPP